MSVEILNDYVPQQAVFTVEEFAELLRVSKSTGYALIRENRIRTIKIGSKGVRIPRKAVVEFLEAEEK